MSVSYTSILWNKQKKAYDLGILIVSLISRLRRQLVGFGKFDALPVLEVLKEQTGKVDLA
ncbi:MAG: hypothetical protein O2887_12130 [Bacteroidetes bacterium]|nr:hypothetical protein [Bacteroidota bacterium]MDA1121219.1 hypothetical protein [Bacteroidota bacterium]